MHMSTLYKMIQFSDRNEKTTRLFTIIFWALVGFHIIFGCIPQLICYAIIWLQFYKIIDTVDIQLYLMAFYLYQWGVS